MIGFSINLNDDINFIKEYVDRMKKSGFTDIFTTIYEPEENKSQYLEKLTELSKYAEEKKMVLMLGTSKESLEDVKLNIDPQTLINLGIKGVRVSRYASNQTIAELSRYFLVGISASHKKKEDIDEISDLGGNLDNLQAWFYYYEKSESGISFDYVKKTRKFWNKMGIKTVAFAPGDYDNLIGESRVTLEKHRGLNPLYSTIELIKDLKIDKVYIGDSPLKNKTIYQFQRLMFDNIICLFADPIDTEYFHLVEGRHINRIDEADNLIKFEERTSQGSERIVDRFLISRPKGSLTIDNHRSGRFMGEINITKIDLPISKKVNVVAHIREKDLLLLDKIRGGDPFEIIDNKNDD